MAKKAETTKEYFEIKGMAIGNVRRLSDSVVAFTLAGKGLGLYNMRVVDGKKGKFVATPQIKGKDDEYYVQYAVYLTDEDQKKIIAAVEKMLPDEPEEEQVEF